MKHIPVYGIKEFSQEGSEIYFYSNDLISHLKSHLFINNPHKHNTYITIIFTRGTGEHQIDFSGYSVKRGSVFLLTPGQVHCWKLSEDAEGYVFFHTGEFYDRTFMNRKISDFPFFYLKQNYPVVYLDEKEISEVVPVFKEINGEFYDHKPLKVQKLGSLVDLLYINLSRFYQDKSAEKEPIASPYFYKVKEFQRLIDLHFQTQKSPQEYADQMNMTARHLNRICQEVLDKTAGALITERIILEARRLLVHKDVTINEVADQLGYLDVSYFIKVFKKHTGVSPGEFQKGTIKPFAV